MQTVQQQASLRLTRMEALRKWWYYSDSAINAFSRSMEAVMENLVKAGATEETIKTFWLEVKHLSWPSTYGQSPWQTASLLGAALEARDLGKEFDRIGNDFVEPFLAATRSLRIRCVTMDADLKPFRVMLHEMRGDKFKTAYDCMATDCEHAADLAESAYPGCILISCSWSDDSFPESNR